MCDLRNNLNKLEYNKILLDNTENLLFKNQKDGKRTLTHSIIDKGEPSYLSIKNSTSLAKLLKLVQSPVFSQACASWWDSKFWEKEIKLKKSLSILYYHLSTTFFFFFVFVGVLINHCLKCTMKMSKRKKS